MKMVTVQTRECIEGDAGEVVRGYYVVTGGFLRMCDENGQLAGKSYKLSAGDDERRIATELLRKQMRRAPTSDFNRPLVYARSGVA